MTRRGIVSVAVASAMTVLVGACSATDESGGPGSSETTSAEPGPAGDGLVDLARTLPSLPGSETFTLTFGDVAAIAGANDVAVPDDRDLEGLLDWASEPSSGGVPVLLPEILQEMNLARHDEFDDELGVSLWGTQRYVGVESPPYRVGLLDGDHGPEDLTEAIGEPVDGVWSVGGEELRIDMDDRTAARPLGEALRLSAGERGVVIASTDRLAIGAAVGEGSLVDDGVDAVLTALDDESLVSGLVVRSLLGDAGPSTNGTAYGLEDGRVVARLALGYPDAPAAAVAVGKVEEYLTEGSSLSGPAWADLLTVDDVTASGSAVVVDVSFTDEQRPDVLVQMLTGFVTDLPQARL